LAVYEYGLGLCAQSAIRNRRVTLEFKAVKASTLAIAGRSISTLTQGVGDLYQMYLFSRENQVDYNLAYIRETSPSQARKPSIPNTCLSYSSSASDLGKAAANGRRHHHDWAIHRGAEIT